MADSASRLASCDAFIVYDAFADEPDVRAFLEEQGIKKPLASVPSEGSADPFVLADKFAEELNGKNVGVFVPGRAMDFAGTRHGRGGGWYDRFLSRIPAAWVRIGVVPEARFSKTPLVRKEWDEPVDYVLVKGAGWDMMATNARLQSEPGASR
jgi:hypothetical protein